MSRSHVKRANEPVEGLPEDDEFDPDEGDDEGDDEGGDDGVDAAIEAATVDPKEIEDPRVPGARKAPRVKRPSKAEEETDSPVGWRFLYEVSYPSGERTPEHTLSDCFDLKAAMHEIAQYHGACRGQFRVLAPFGAKVQPNYQPRTRDEDGRVRQCERRGTFTVPATYVLREFGYLHIPLADKTNLLHREVAPPDVVAAAQFSGGQESNTRAEDHSGPDSSPMSRAAMHQLEQIRQQMASIANASPKEDFGTTLERMRLADELRRQQRRIEREEEEDAERKAREKRRLEREEEEDARRARWAEDDRRRKAEAEIDRERRREEFEHQLRLSREEHQARREEARLEMEREKSRSGEGGPLGAMLLNAIVGRVEDSLGGGGLIEKIFGGKSDDDDEPGMIGQLSKVTGLVEKLVGFSKMVPAAAQPGAQAQIPQLRPAQQRPQAAAPATPTPTPVQQPQIPQPKKLMDSEEYPAMQAEDGTVIVKTPEGYGVRTPQGLFAVDAKFTEELDRSFAEGDEEDGEEDDEETYFEDEMQEIAFTRLRKQAPMLEPVVLALLEGLRPMAKISKFDVDLLSASCSGVLEELDADELVAAHAAIKELDADEFVDNLPWFAESAHRAGLKTDAARNALRETLERLKATVKPG